MGQKYDVWVDFNRVNQWGEITSLLKWAPNPTGIRRGERVTVGSNLDGDYCFADVLKVETNGLIYLRLDWNTYWHLDVEG